MIDFINSGKMKYGEGEKEAMHAVLHATAKDIMSTKCENVSPEMEVEDFVKLIKERIKRVKNQLVKFQLKMLKNCLRELY